MSEREMVGSWVGGGVRCWSVLSGAFAVSGVLVSLYLLSRSNYLLFHSIIETLERSSRWFHRAAVAGSLDYGGGPDMVMGFIADVSSFRPAQEELR